MLDWIAVRPRSPKRVVGLDRLERSTSPLSGVRSNHLSYRPMTGARCSSPAARPIRRACLSKKEKRRRRSLAPFRAAGLDLPSLVPRPEEEAGKARDISAPASVLCLPVP
jgi:hypothetical protein